MAVVAFIDREPDAEATLHYAAWAVRTLNQQLVLVTLADGSSGDAALSFEAFGSMDAREDVYRDLLPPEGNENSESDAAAVDLVHAAARRARELGVERVRTVVTRDPLSYFIETSTNSSDLLVFYRGNGDGPDTNRALDEILHIRNRMLLLAPETFAEPKCWLMAIDGGPSAGHAVQYLIDNPLIRAVPGTAAIVGPDHHRRLHFRDAINHLKSAGYSVIPHEMQGGADDVLLAIMQVAPVDLLVMGAYGQGKFRSLFERSTTARLLGTFKGPVLVARA